MNPLKKIIVLILIFSGKLTAQSTFLHIKDNATSYYVEKKTELNDFNKKDTLVVFYKLKDNKKNLLTTHYLYKYGADCNNEFKDFGSYEIKGDSIILKTRYWQKGHDPIAQKSKQIYVVKPDGKLNLLYNKEYIGGKWVNIKK